VTDHLDDRVNGVAGGHPLDEPRIRAERDDGVAHDSEFDLRRCPVDGEKRVDEAEQLHDALVLSEVLVALEQERVVDAVAAAHGQPPRVLFGRQDFQRRPEERDADGGRADAVRAWNAQLQIVGDEKFRRNVVQLQLGRLRLLTGGGGTNQRGQSKETG